MDGGEGTLRARRLKSLVVLIRPCSQSGRRYGPRHVTMCRAICRPENKHEMTINQ